ncbi:MAG: GyrI-like domain-containing protein [Spirochaetes bacterium]|nr:GyrI-like domain-containing protein [Spirochaetota bacterium]MBU1079045.1 GyrI-like domain-containing protein [Spirochaetota bacterium]
MEYRLERARPFVLVGMNFFGNPFRSAGAWDEDNEIGSLWKRLMAYLAADPGAVAALPRGDPAWFEAHVLHPSSAVNGDYEVFIGAETAEPLASPAACVVKVLPAADYAVATLRGDEMTPGWEERLAADALARYGRPLARGWGLQRYDSRFKGLGDPGSAFEAWSPLVPPDTAR